MWLSGDNHIGLSVRAGLGRHFAGHALGPDLPFRGALAGLAGAAAEISAGIVTGSYGMNVPCWMAHSLASSLYSTRSAAATLRSGDTKSTFSMCIASRESREYRRLVWRSSSA
jgi:hypothetical protein